MAIISHHLHLEDLDFVQIDRLARVLAFALCNVKGLISSCQHVQRRHVAMLST